MTLKDDTGHLTLFWFHAYPSLKKELEEGTRLLVYGEVRFFGALPRIAHPEFEPVEMDGEKPRASSNFGRVVPVYSETEGLHQKAIRRILAEAIRVSVEHLSDALPLSMREKYKMPSLRESFISAHYPKEIPEEGVPTAAVRRIIFEEFFILQLGLGLKKQKWQRDKAPILIDERKLLPQFLQSLPFTLTKDQQNTLSEIMSDVSKPRTMARLVQGDVGSGKTAVAFASAVLAASNGFQTALVAPTEVLAQQHFKLAKSLFEKIGLSVALLVHGEASKKENKEAVSEGKADLVIGTHALFQEKVAFKKLGLVIFDEQHRFGVEQRSELIRKGTELVPHLLMMTATPIPRTLALTLYGDLDLSIIREKPAGRKPVKTSILYDRERPKLYQKIRAAVQRGEQVYVIYPLVENSEKLELKSATEMYEKLKTDVFPDLTLRLLHGRLKGDEKDAILKEFKEGKFSILISTTVIEVGIDVPNATLMVIEHPERLGLSQLHQLRGRVGRGKAASECCLVAEKFATERLKVMVKTEDGFEIAEEDLKIRGPGEFLGTRQSGMPGFRVGHILRDAALLSLAREEAQSILQKDPELALSDHSGIRAMVESRWKEKIERLRGG